VSDPTPKQVYRNKKKMGGAREWGGSRIEEFCPGRKATVFQKDNVCGRERFLSSVRDRYRSPWGGELKRH